MHADYHTGVTVLTDAPCHHGHEGILKTVHMDNVLPLTQQSGKSHWAIDVGHTLQRQDGDGDFQAAILLKHHGILAAHNLDIEVIITAQSVHQIIGVLLSTGPVLIGDYVENVDHQEKNWLKHCWQVSGQRCHEDKHFFTNLHDLRAKKISQPSQAD